jgi:hypothetical protein
MGQPHLIQLHWSPLVGYDWDSERRVSRFTLSVGGEPRIPQFGLVQTSFAGFAGERAGALDYGLATYLKIPWVHAGLEFSIPDEDLIATFAAEFALRRGGLLHRGDAIRLDYRPWKREILLGLTLVEPLRRYRRARPLAMHVALPEGEIPRAVRPIRKEGLPRDLEESLQRLEHHIVWIDRLLTPHFQPGREFAESAALYRAHRREVGHTFADEEAGYHEELERAFTIATDADTAAGRELALHAEAILLDRVLIPFNHCFAQIKKPANVEGYAEQGLREFERALAGRFGAEPVGVGGLDPAEASTRRELCREVFRRTLGAIDGVARSTRKRWDQKFIFIFPEFRLVWLPLNYGVRPGQVDTQDEWDRLTERLTGRAFTDCNTVEYLVNEQFHLRLKAMVRAAETYHVLHIHDVRGLYERKLTDRIGWDLAIDGYLRAFTEAVGAIDRSERRHLPQFLLFLDENFYADNRSRGIVTFLENLYAPETPESIDEPTLKAVMHAQRALLAAIEASPTFGRLSERERRRLFKVHVNITHPFDLTFGGDAPLRDHRKVAFRDVVEDDPASGEAIATGQGVGEHYNGTGWDDRSIVVRGPALVAFKTGARELFLSQGYEEKDVPGCLRALPVPRDYEERCEALRMAGWTTPVSVVMNRVGYGEKIATVLKAMQYNLAPPGSTILTFDSLWISDYWAGMLAAAAMRGVGVHVVAPTVGNAPSSAVPTMVLLRENMSRLFEASQVFAEEIAAAGGSLNVGLYATGIPVTDLRGRLEGAVACWEGDPRMNARFGLDASVLDTLRTLAAMWPLEPAPEDTPRVAVIPIRQDHKPFLHMKTQLLVDADAMRAVRRQEWAHVMEEHLRVRARQAAGCLGPGITPELPFDGGPDEGIAALLIGSQNQDRRGMMMDGEVTVTVSGPHALVALPDLMLILGNATWPRDRDEFTRTFPEIKAPGFLKRAFRYIKDQI